MNILLWILQVLLALWNIIGGTYTISHYEVLKSPWASDFPKPVWLAIGALQVLFALGLVLPGVTSILPRLTSVSAIYLTINSLAGCALFAKYAGFPGLLWGVVPAILTAFIAYGRSSLIPF